MSSESIKKKCIEEVLARISEQEDSEFGFIAAEDIIDIVVQHIGPDLYNLALEDAKKLINNKLSDLVVDLDVLEQK